MARVWHVMRASRLNFPRADSVHKTGSISARVNGIIPPPVLSCEKSAAPPRRTSLSCDGRKISLSSAISAACASSSKAYHLTPLDHCERAGMNGTRSAASLQYCFTVCNFLLLVAFFIVFLSGFLGGLVVNNSIEDIGDYKLHDRFGEVVERAKRCNKRLSGLAASNAYSILSLSIVAAMLDLNKQKPLVKRVLPCSAPEVKVPRRVFHAADVVAAPLHSNVFLFHCRIVVVCWFYC